MTMETIPARFGAPDTGAGTETQDNTASIRFGDGYSQDASLGINYQRHVHTLTWTRENVLDEIFDWFQRGKKVRRFLWTYRGKERMYRCTECKLTDDTPQIPFVTVTIEEVFDVRSLM